MGRGDPPHTKPIARASSRCGRDIGPACGRPRSVPGTPRARHAGSLGRQLAGRFAHTAPGVARVWNDSKSIFNLIRAHARAFRRRPGANPAGGPRPPGTNLPRPFDSRSRRVAPWRVAARGNAPRGGGPAPPGVPVRPHRRHTGGRGPLSDPGAPPTTIGGLVPSRPVISRWAGARQGRARVGLAGRAPRDSALESRGARNQGPRGRPGSA